jgi:membrane protein
LPFITASTFRSVIRIGRESELPFLAGSVAFFAFFSLVPSLVLVVALGSVLGGEQFALRVVALFGSYLSAEGTALISDALVDQSGLVGASVVGVFALFWSTLKVFRAIDIAFDRIYETDRSTSLPQRLLNGTIVVMAVGAGIGLLFTAQMMVVQLNLGLSRYDRLLSVPILLLGLLIVLAPIYYIMPPVRIPVREIVPGTITAVIGLIALQQMFHIYASLAGQYQAYGFLGAVLLFLLWLYFGALILLVGAVVNVAVAK